MTENYDDEQNIDDLVDYNDFDSKDLDSNNDMDSFNCDIAKFYEDHKKNVNNKTNEVTNNQRPISSYQRVLLTDNKKGTDEATHNEEEDYEEKYDYDFEDKNAENSKASESKNVTLAYNISPTFNNNFNYEISELKEAVEKFNNFIQKTKITQIDFCDDLKMFYSLPVFKDLFKKIRFDISNKEARMLFNHNNPYKDEGYIQMKNFFDNFNLNFRVVDFDKVNTDYDIKRLNEEFKTLHVEILEIVKNDIVNDNLKRQVKSAQYKNKPVSGKINTKPNSGVSKMKLELDSAKKPTLQNHNNILIMSSNSTNPLPMTSSIPERPKLDIKQNLKENLKKQKEEEIVIRQSFDKRQKEFIRDCFKKISEANKICSEMNIPRYFSSFTDLDGSIKCAVLEQNLPRDENNPILLELKAFLVEWRILCKSYILRNNHFNMGKVTKVATEIRSPSRSPSPVFTDKREIQKQIKKVLVNSIRLKMKLKQQVTSLKQNFIIDEKDILEHLKLTSLYKDK